MVSSKGFGCLMVSERAVAMSQAGTTALSKYPDRVKAEALILMALNNYNSHVVSEIMNIPASTIRRWNRTLAEDITRIPVQVMIDRTINHLLGHIPQNLSGRDWVEAVSVLMDKWLLMNGLPTNRTQLLGKGFFGLDDNELALVLTDAQSIISGVARDPTPEEEGRSSSTGSSELEE